LSQAVVVGAVLAAALQVQELMAKRRYMMSAGF
jgi:hypothetical protein